MLEEVHYQLQKGPFLQPLGQYEGGRHGLQSALFAASWNLPAAHCWQTLAPGSEVIVPGLQPICCDVPPAQLKPGRHGLQPSLGLVDVVLVLLPEK